MRRLLVFLILSTTLPLVVYAKGTTTFQFDPSKTVVAVGEKFTVEVDVASPNQTMNAVSGSVIFPGVLSVDHISTDGSIINFWTQQPVASANKIKFEGVVLNPGYRGEKGKLFTVTFTALKESSAVLSFINGAILANDGLGTNILDTLRTLTISIHQWDTAPIATTEGSTPPPVTSSFILPVITNYSQSITTPSGIFVKGRGAPNALTKIVFKDVALKSIGERFMDFIQSKKTALDTVLVKNDSSGSFEYTSGNNLIAGVYNATPYLVDESTNTDRRGLGVQLLVNDSKIVHELVILINILGLLVPIVGLMMLIYFIPWYSTRRMHLLKRRLGLEEEKIQLTEHKLKHNELLIDRAPEENKSENGS